MRYTQWIIVGLVLTSCAHHRDVRPGVDGVNRVIVKAEDADSGSRDAISQANHFCEQRNQTAVFIDEGSKYTGSMNESDYKTAKTVSKVAEAAGGALWVFGGKNESTVGGVAATGGGIADSVIGKGYTYEMKFKCQ